jgi:hypothetical protein
VDFADFRFPWGKRYALLVVLGYSRLLWVRFFPRKNTAALYEGLEAAFRFFGGVPRELLFDQLKNVILEDRRMDGGELLKNEEFLRFAAHWGLPGVPQVRACRPYRGGRRKPTGAERCRRGLLRWVEDGTIGGPDQGWGIAVSFQPFRKDTGLRPLYRYRDHFNPPSMRAPPPLNEVWSCARRS